MDHEDRWLSVEKVAEHLGVSKDTVYRWIEQKDLPAHRVGRLWKFDKSEVDKWVRSGSAGQREVTSRKDVRSKRKGVGRRRSKS